MTSTSTHPPEAARAVRGTLPIVCAATVLVLVAYVTPLGTGVRTAAALGAGPAGLTWVLSGMSVGLAAVLLTAGVLADEFGQRRVFVGGLVLLAAASVLVGVAGNVGVVVAARVVEGVGGAAVLAGALGMIGHAFPPGPARGRAASLWGASVGAGTGIGGMVTVLLDPADGAWRVTYLVTAVAGLVLAALALRVLPRIAASGRRRVDVVGVVLLSAGMSALLAGLVEGRAGWGRPGVWILVGAGLALLAAFGLAELRQRQPMIDPRLFRSPGFTGATAAALVVGVAVIGVASYTPTVLQRGLGATLLAATVLVLIWSAVSTLTAWLLRAAHAVDGRLLLVAALAVSAVGLALLALLAVGGSEWRLLPGLLVLGVGYGAANSALGREAIAHVPLRQAGMGSGTNNTARYFGAALGVTLAALVAPTAATAEALVHGFDVAALAAGAVSLAGAVVVALIRPARVAAIATPAPAQ